MDSRQIEAAYVPFADTLRAGGFVQPAEGWDASLIAAHVATNNDLIAAVAEQIADGQHPSYDNADVIDDGQLQGVAADTGGLGNLARLVTVSAARLARAWEALGPERGETEVPAKIADGGRVVRDGPIPIRQFIEVNATFHIQLHLEQLQQLLP